MPSAHSGCEATFFHLEIPLRVPFLTATGAITGRSLGLVSLTRSGQTGWGEAAPYPGQDEPFGNVLDAVRTGRDTPTLNAAIDEAACALNARERGASLASDLGDTLEAGPAALAGGLGDAARTMASEAWEGGISRFKVKVMPGRTRHVVGLRERLPGAIIGVDANSSFDSETVGELVELADAGIAYVEQPTGSIDDPALERLAEAGLAVFLDESVRSVEAAEHALGSPFVAGVVIKPGRLGWTSSVKIVDMARRRGKRWRASGLLESGVGRSFSLLLAAASDAFISDMVPASHVFSYDVAPHAVVDGHIAVPHGRGTGAVVDTEAIEAHALEKIRFSGSAIQGSC